MGPACMDGWVGGVSEGGDGGTNGRQHRAQRHPPHTPARGLTPLVGPPGGGVGKPVAQLAGADVHSRSAHAVRGGRPRAAPLDARRPLCIRTLVGWVGGWVEARWVGFFLFRGSRWGVGFRGMRGGRGVASPYTHTQTAHPLLGHTHPPTRDSALVLLRAQRRHQRLAVQPPRRAFFPCLPNTPQVVPLPPQRAQQGLQRARHVQQRGGAGGAHPRGKTVAARARVGGWVGGCERAETCAGRERTARRQLAQHMHTHSPQRSTHSQPSSEPASDSQQHCDAALVGGRAPQLHPLAQAAGQARHSLRHKEDVVAHQPTQGDCMGGLQVIGRHERAAARRGQPKWSHPPAPTHPPHTPTTHATPRHPPAHATHPPTPPTHPRHTAPPTHATHPRHTAPPTHATHPPTHATHLCQSRRPALAVSTEPRSAAPRCRPAPTKPCPEGGEECVCGGGGGRARASQGGT